MSSWNPRILWMNEWFAGPVILNGISSTLVFPLAIYSRWSRLGSIPQLMTPEFRLWAGRSRNSIVTASPLLYTSIPERWTLFSPQHRGSRSRWRRSEKLISALNSVYSCSTLQPTSEAMWVGGTVGLIAIPFSHIFCGKTEFDYWFSRSSHDFLFLKRCIYLLRPPPALFSPFRSFSSTLCNICSSGSTFWKICEFDDLMIIQWSFNDFNLILWGYVKLYEFIENWDYRPGKIHGHCANCVSFNHDLIFTPPSVKILVVFYFICIPNIVYSISFFFSRIFPIYPPLPQKTHMLHQSPFV